MADGVIYVFEYGDSCAVATGSNSGQAATDAEYWKSRTEVWRRLACGLGRENDELRRENERLLAALAERNVPAKAEPAPEMCCGGTCVRALCFIHGGG